MSARVAHRARLVCAALAIAGCRSRTDSAQPLPVEYDGCEAVMGGPICVLGTDLTLRLWLSVAPDASLEVRTDGVPVELASAPLAGGRALTVHVPEGARRLEVSATEPAAVSDAAHEEVVTRTWALAMASPRPRPAVLEEAQRLREAGEIDEGIALLAASAPTLAPADQGAAYGALARLQRLAGKPELALQSFETALARHRAAGSLLAEVNDATALVYVLVHSGLQLSRARQVLKGVAALLPENLRAEYLVAYYQGIVASQTADFRASLVALDRAAIAAAKMGSQSDERFADQMRANTLLAVGRHREAVQLLAELVREAPTESPCARYEPLESCAWGLLLAREAGEDPARWSATVPFTDPEPLLREAIELRERRCARYPEAAGNLHVNLALAALHAGRPVEARQHLSRARAVLPAKADLSTLWAVDIEARLCLREGDARLSLSLYQELGERARLAASPDVVWRAHVGRAEAFTALRDLASADAEYQRAAQIAYEQSLSVPLHEGRDIFLAQRHQVAARHVALLLEAKAPARAMQVARAWRGQLLAGLRWQDAVERLDPALRTKLDDALAEYALERQRLEELGGAVALAPRDEMAAAQARFVDQEARLRAALDDALAIVPAPVPGSGPRSLELKAGDATAAVGDAEAPGTLTLTYFALGDALVGFAASHTTVLAARLPAVSPATSNSDDLAVVLLEPFRSQLQTAKRVRVIATADLERVDFHALPFAGRPLLATLPVSYAVDAVSAPAVPAASADERAPRDAGSGFEELQGSAVVIADPRGDLPKARLEGDSVAATLAATNRLAEVRVLAREAATAAAVRQSLGVASMLHYAGHAEFDAAGIRSALLLADNGVLSAGDVLSLAHVPRLVVLSACESARAPAAKMVSTVGLAQAFVIAGAKSVVATTRPIDDAVAAHFSRAFYGILAGSGSGSGSGEHERTAKTAVEAAFQTALLATQQAFPNADWASIRLLVP